MYPNPYSPPGAYAPPPMPGAASGHFVALGWRTTLATLAIVSQCVMSFALDGTQLAFSRELAESEPAVLPSLLVGATALGMTVSLVFAVVFFSIFIHRAASNVRALGRYGMEYTPGWCVGWFFVPFANLYRPYRAVAEVFRSSDPAAGVGGDWMGGPSVPGVFNLWWGTWIVAGLFSNASGRINDPVSSGAVGLIGSVLLMVSAVACISIMNQIAARQNATASRAGTAPY